MTSDELRMKFHHEFGLDRPWPKTYEVDAETYVNCFKAVVQNKYNQRNFITFGNNEDGHYNSYQISCGTVNQGLMFKEVELILKDK